MTLFIAFPTTYVICLINTPSLIGQVIETSVRMSVPIVVTCMVFICFIVSVDPDIGDIDGK